MKFLQKYNSCIYCKTNTIFKLNKQSFIDNFYLRAIRQDLNISKKYLKKIKVFECQKCKIIQNNPWFTENVSRRIYSNIYGQHNRSWSNLLNYFHKNKFPNHGQLFEILTKNINVKNYAEFNSPFMGLFMNFFSKEHNLNNKHQKDLLNNTLKYLSSRQLAGKNKNVLKNSIEKSKKLYQKISVIKKKFRKNKKFNKYLYIDNSPLCWGQNDNHMSVNSKSLANELFEIEIKNLLNDKSKIKFDLFGIFHTLDHTFEPKKIFDFAINNSKYVVIYCHVDRRLEKQHLFSITNEFVSFLEKNKIYTLDLTDKINKIYKNKELYFLCSRNKEKIKNIKI